MASTQAPRTRQLQALRGLVAELEARDPEARSHSELVSLYGAAIATKLSWSDDRIDSILLAGVMHDVGKAILPHHILFKPGPLTAEEWHEVKRHPEAGAWMVSEAGCRDIAVWVLFHHEHFDGGGYPFGLAGDEIPVESRVLAVADAYEAMTADRVYRPRLSHEAACEELRRCAGGQFDPAVVEQFLDTAPMTSPAIRDQALAHRATTGRRG